MNTGTDLREDSLFRRTISGPLAWGACVLLLVAGERRRGSVPQPALVTLCYPTTLVVANINTVSVSIRFRLSVEDSSVVVY